MSVQHFEPPSPKVKHSPDRILQAFLNEIKATRAKREKEDVSDAKLGAENLKLLQTSHIDGSVLHDVKVAIKHHQRNEQDIELLKKVIHAAFAAGMIAERAEVARLFEEKARMNNAEERGNTEVMVGHKFQETQEILAAMNQKKDDEQIVRSKKRKCDDHNHASFVAVGEIVSLGETTTTAGPLDATMDPILPILHNSNAQDSKAFALHGIQIEPPRPQTRKPYLRNPNSPSSQRSYKAVARRLGEYKMPYQEDWEETLKLVGTSEANFQQRLDKAKAYIEQEAKKNKTLPNYTFPKKAISEFEIMAKRNSAQTSDQLDSNMSDDNSLDDEGPIVDQVDNSRSHKKPSVAKLYPYKAVTRRLYLNWMPYQEDWDDALKIVGVSEATFQKKLDKAKAFIRFDAEKNNTVPDYSFPMKVNSMHTKRSANKKAKQSLVQLDSIMGHNLLDENGPTTDQVANPNNLQSQQSPHIIDFAVQTVGSHQPSMSDNSMSSEHIDFKHVLNRAANQVVSQYQNEPFVSQQSLEAESSSINNDSNDGQQTPTSPSNEFSYPDIFGGDHQNQANFPISGGFDTSSTSINVPQVFGNSYNRNESDNLSQLSDVLSFQVHDQSRGQLGMQQSNSGQSLQGFVSGDEDEHELFVRPWNTSAQEIDPALLNPALQDPGSVNIAASTLGQGYQDSFSEDQNSMIAGSSGYSSWSQFEKVPTLNIVPSQAHPRILPQLASQFLVNLDFIQYVPSSEKTPKKTKKLAHEVDQAVLISAPTQGPVLSPIPVNRPASLTLAAVPATSQVILFPAVSPRTGKIPDLWREMAPKHYVLRCPHSSCQGRSDFDTLVGIQGHMKQNVGHLTLYDNLGPEGVDFLKTIPLVGIEVVDAKDDLAAVEEHNKAAVDATKNAGKRMIPHKVHHTKCGCHKFVDL